MDFPSFLAGLLCGLTLGEQVSGHPTDTEKSEQPTEHRTEDSENPQQSAPITRSAKIGSQVVTMAYDTSGLWRCWPEAS
jgi:hypothetical protein